MGEVRLDPIPRILIESMRDIGYSFEAALADIIDNAITANARNIDIWVRNSDESLIAVADDGDGLTREELLSAMRMGSTNPRKEREKGDLGRFGLGMKTASFSQCRKLTVVSGKNGSRNGFTWDLDSVAECNEWNVIEESLDGPLPFYWEFPETGTIVIWSKIDRIASNEKSGLKSFDRIVSDAEEHISLVFHRFLAGEVGCPKITIRINGREIEPLDPFNRKHTATIPGPEEPLPGGVTVQSFTLPHETKYATHAEYEKYGLRGGYLKNQGIYLYRAKRLIIHGTWFNLAKKSALTQLCRVKIDIDNTKDEGWKIDIKKVSAQLPEEARTTIKRLLSRFSSPSKSVYKRRGAKQTTAAYYPMWNSIKDNGFTRYEINREHPTIRALRESLENDEVEQLNYVLSAIESGFPLDALFVDLSNMPESVKPPKIDKESFRQITKDFFGFLKAAGADEQTILDQMKLTPMFFERWEEVLLVLNIEED